MEQFRPNSARKERLVALKERRERERAEKFQNFYDGLTNSAPSVIARAGHNISTQHPTKYLVLSQEASKPGARPGTADFLPRPLKALLRAQSADGKWSSEGEHGTVVANVLCGLPAQDVTRRAVLPDAAEGISNWRWTTALVCEFLRRHPQYFTFTQTAYTMGNQWCAGDESLVAAAAASLPANYIAKPMEYALDPTQIRSGRWKSALDSLVQARGYLASIAADARYESAKEREREIYTRNHGHPRGEPAAETTTTGRAGPGPGGPTTTARGATSRAASPQRLGSAHSVTFTEGTAFPRRLGSAGTATTTGDFGGFSHEYGGSDAGGSEVSGATATTVGSIGSAALDAADAVLSGRVDMNADVEEWDSLTMLDTEVNGRRDEQSKKERARAKKQRMLARMQYSGLEFEFASSYGAADPSMVVVAERSPNGNGDGGLSATFREGGPLLPDRGPSQGQQGQGQGETRVQVRTSPRREALVELTARWTQPITQAAELKRLTRLSILHQYGTTAEWCSHPDRIEGVGIGDEVTHAKRGAGKVVKINVDGDMCIHVKFAQGKDVRYKMESWRAKIRSLNVPTTTTRGGRAARSIFEAAATDATKNAARASAHRRGGQGASSKDEWNASAVVTRRRFIDDPAAGGVSKESSRKQNRHTPGRRGRGGRGSKVGGRSRRRRPNAEGTAVGEGGAEQGGGTVAGDAGEAPAQQGSPTPSVRSDASTPQGQGGGSGSEALGESANADALADEQLTRALESTAAAADSVNTAGMEMREMLVVTQALMHLDTMIGRAQSIAAIAAPAFADAITHYGRAEAFRPLTDHLKEEIRPSMWAVVAAVLEWRDQVKRTTAKLRSERMQMLIGGGMHPHQVAAQMAVEDAAKAKVYVVPHMHWRGQNALVWVVHAMDWLDDVRGLRMWLGDDFPLRRNPFGMPNSLDERPATPKPAEEMAIIDGIEVMVRSAMKQVQLEKDERAMRVWRSLFEPRALPLSAPWWPSVGMTDADIDRVREYEKVLLREEIYDREKKQRLLVEVDVRPSSPVRSSAVLAAE